jgi:hypothetical protein
LKGSLVRRFLVLAVLAGVVFSASSARADEADLAKQLSNPVSSLISVPFQFNYDCCFGPSRGSRATLNIQPVVPIKLNDDWNMIVRTILPVESWNSPAPGVGYHFGLGDITQSFFFSPRNLGANGIVWGIGPVFLWPTGTDDSLGSRKFGAGPTAVLLKQANGWTYGILANHIWSYGSVAGGTQNVSATFLQPFVNYTWPDTTGITLNTESTYDWIAKQWTVPVNIQISHIYKFGSQPVSFSIGPRFYLVSPSNGPDWGVRGSITLLFPVKQ